MAGTKITPITYDWQPTQSSTSSTNEFDTMIIAPITPITITITITPITPIGNQLNHQLLPPMHLTPLSLQLLSFGL